MCGTIAATCGFAAGYLTAGSLLAAAALATVCEAVGFYGCVGAKTAVAAYGATAHLGGLRRLAAGAWHAITGQLASCAAAEALDEFLIRPGCLAGAAWLARPLPGGVWLGLAVGNLWTGQQKLAPGPGCFNGHRMILENSFARARAEHAAKNVVMIYLLFFLIPIAALLAWAARLDWKRRRREISGHDINTAAYNVRQGAERKIEGPRPGFQGDPGRGPLLAG